MASYLELQADLLKRPPCDWRDVYRVKECIPRLKLFNGGNKLRNANHSVLNLFNCLFPFQVLFVNKLTLTAWSFPFTSISGTSWYQGDKFRATWTVTFAGSRTSWVGPMVSPSVITALIVQRKRLFHQTRVWHTFLLQLAANFALIFGSSFFRVCLCHLLHNIIFHSA